MWDSYFILTLKKLFLKSITNISLGHYPLIILRLGALKFLPVIFTLLKLSTATRLNTLVELTAYDIPNHLNRFTLNFFLLSIEYNYRIAVNISVPQVEFVPSVSSIYVNAS